VALRVPYWIGPNSLIPYCVTIRRASSVAFSKSLLAPVVTFAKLDFFCEPAT